MNGKVTSVIFYLISGLPTDFILGLDWLEKNNIVVNFGRKQLSIDPRRATVTDKKVVIPPQSEAVLVARIKGSPLPSGVVGITHGSNYIASSGLLSDKSMSRVNNNTVFQKCANFTYQPVHIRKGANLGKFICLSSADKIVV